MSTAVNSLEATRLEKRYGRTWALRDCTFALLAGRIAALVGPNGAGKSTLLQLAAGLLSPTAGALSVLGHPPVSAARVVLPRIGFVAQDHPLYGGLSVAETLRLGRKLNPRWDDALARTRLDQLGIPLARRVSQLSGGQQAQVALVLALAKRPEVLLLDEPLASLDPVARRDFLRVMLDAAVESGTTVLLSSHIISDLERTCDYLVILNRGAVRLSNDLEDAVRTHKRLVGPRQATDDIASRHTIIETSDTPAQTSLLVRLNGPLFGSSWDVQDVSLEEVVLAYLDQSTYVPSSRHEATEVRK